MTYSIIVAVGEGNWVIGDDQGLPWRMPADLARFRRMTAGKPVIMGRKTRDLIGRPLIGRDNIVLTRRADYQPYDTTVAHSLAEAAAAAQGSIIRYGADEVMVIGGADVYRQYLPLASRIYLTVIQGNFKGNTCFPRNLVGAEEWVADTEYAYLADDRNPHPHTFQMFTRMPRDHAAALQSTCGYTSAALGSTDIRGYN